MPLIPLPCLPKPRPYVCSGRVFYRNPQYDAWRTDIQHALLHLRATHTICDMPYTQPVCLTLHIAQAPHQAHIPATAKHAAYVRTIQPSGDADNLAGGFMDAASTILYTDDRLVHELHVTLDRAAQQDSISFACTPIEQA